MSQPGSPSESATATLDDVGRDLDAAVRAFTASRKRSGVDGRTDAPDLVRFLGSLSFLVTIGYLTKPQAEALLVWFQSDFTAALPPLPGPEGFTPTMYEILGAAVRIGTPPDGADFLGIGGFLTGLLETAIDGVIAKVVADGVTEEEIERAKNRLIASTIYAEDSAQTVAQAIGTSLTSGESLLAVQDWPATIESVTVEDVNAAARKYLDIRRSVTGYLVGSNEQSPS